MDEQSQLRYGYYVKLVIAGREESSFVRIGSSEPFDYESGTGETAEFSAIASGAESGFKNISEIDPSHRPPRLMYVRWGVQDGCKYYLKIPAGTNRLGVDKNLDVGFITNEKSPYFAMDPMYSFWIIQDNYPAVNAVNNTPDALTPKVFFKGLKYDFSEINPEKEPDVFAKLKNYEKGLPNSLPFTVITIGGVKT